MALYRSNVHGNISATHPAPVEGNSQMMTGRINLHLYPGSLRHQSRILKTTATLEQAGLFDAIHVAGIPEEGAPQLQGISVSRVSWRVPVRLHRFAPRLKTLAFFAEWYARVLWRYRHAELTAIQCHSVFDLPLGVLLKGVGRGRVLIYDAHELETERNGLTGFRQRLLRVVERALIRRVDHVIAVSPSIVDWYTREYGRPVALVRNRPTASALMAARSMPALRERFGIQSGIVFLWHGALISGRGLPMLLDAFARAPRDRHVVFMGYGPLEADIKTYAARHPNIHFHEAVRPEEVRATAAGADVGLSVVENSCLSYYYCLPNKLYEYIQAGLAVIVSDFPDMAAEVDRLGNGWKVEVSSEAILRLVGSLSADEVEQKKQRSRAVADTVIWETEAPVLLEVYRKALVQSRR